MICIGNITVGGSGKTPTIIALHHIIKNHAIFKSPYFLSRGYGSQETEPRRITSQDDAKTVGDEPVLLASHSNTITSVNRFNGAKMAQGLGADCILMDDGFQNTSLKKTLSFLVFDGLMGLGNGHGLPAGPLRESLPDGIERSDAVIIIGDDTRNIAPSIRSLSDEIPIIKARFEPTKPIDKKEKYIGFAGLGYPEKFKVLLNSLTKNLISFHAFPDHHPYSDKDIELLIQNAKDQGATLITTEKDFVRIPEQYQENIDVLPIQLKFDKEEQVINILRKAKL